MKVTIKGYITHKETEKYADCADRYAVNTRNNRFAIADGVSKSFFPDYWADILVNHFVALEKDNSLSINECQAEWLKKVKEKIDTPDIKWYTKNAFIKQEPGLATFVGLRFEKGRWFATALGDSFLFFVSNGNMGFDKWVKLSSKSDPVVFDSFPDYFSSRNKQHGEAKNIDGYALETGTFYLMTDALSEWVFNQKEKAIEEIRKWHSQEEFERSIAELRSLNVLNNDDSAILIIEIEEDGKTVLTYEKEKIQRLSELIENEKSIEEEIENKKESFVEEAKTEIANKKAESRILSDNEDYKEKVEIDNTYTELSQNTQIVYNKCIAIYNDALLKIETAIIGGGNFLEKKYKLPEHEQQLIKEKLKEYGISFENRDSNSN